MFSQFTEEPRRSPHDVIVEIRISEYEWWHTQYTTAWRRGQSGNEIDAQFAGIIKASRDVYVTTASTIDFLEASAQRERAVAQGLRRIRRTRRLKHVGNIIIRCLGALGHCTPGFPNIAPR